MNPPGKKRKTHCDEQRNFSPLESLVRRVQKINCSIRIQYCNSGYPKEEKTNQITHLEEDICWDPKKLHNSVSDFVQKSSGLMVLSKIYGQIRSVSLPWLHIQQ